MKRKEYAYVTFLMRNDSFLPGALVLGHRLRKQQTSHDLVCLVTKDISKQSIKGLRHIYDVVEVVDEIKVSHPDRQSRQDRPYLFTRFQALRLGPYGDLGYGYTKIVLLDADVLPIHSYDKLFKLEAPAGIINEKKSNWVGTQEDSSQEMTVWQKHYNSVCPHGQRIPKDLTDKVWHDPLNMGVNACVWVLEPSMIDYKRILEIVACPKVLQKISHFKWPEMQFATAYYSGRWTSIDYIYCAYNAYPSLYKVYGTHYAGLKPWRLSKKKALIHYCSHPDYQLWYNELIELLCYTYPQITRSSKLDQLIKFYYEHVMKVNSWPVVDV